MKDVEKIAQSAEERLDAAIDFLETVRTDVGGLRKDARHASRLEERGVHLSSEAQNALAAVFDPSISTGPGGEPKEIGDRTFHIVTIDGALVVDGWYLHPSGEWSKEPFAERPRADTTMPEAREPEPMHSH